MTKDEAMKSHRKVTHVHFMAKEWIKMEGGMIKTEDGYYIEPEDFWMVRGEESWNDNWSYYHD